VARSTARHAKRDALRRQDSTPLVRPIQMRLLSAAFRIPTMRRFEILAEPLDVFFKRVVRFVLQPADSKRMRSQPRPAITFRGFSESLPAREAVESRHPDGAWCFHMTCSTTKNSQSGLAIRAAP